MNDEMDESVLLPAGRYRARAVEGALAETSTGRPQVAVLFTLTDPNWAGNTMTWYGYFSEKTQSKTLEALRTCGWKGDDLSDLAGICDNEVSIVVEHENDQDGVTRAKVRWVNRVGSLGIRAPMAPDQARAFAARMKAVAVQSRQQEAALAAAQSAAGKPVKAPFVPPDLRTETKEQIQARMGLTDDDIPF